MKITRLFHLDCSEAESLCDKAQYKETSFLERIRLRLHFALCETCKKYHENNGKLTALIRKAGIQTFTREEKQSMKRKMQAESSKIPKEQ